MEERPKASAMVHNEITREPQRPPPGPDAHRRALMTGPPTPTLRAPTGVTGPLGEPPRHWLGVTQPNPILRCNIIPSSPLAKWAIKPERCKMHGGTLSGYLFSFWLQCSFSSEILVGVRRYGECGLWFRSLFVAWS